MYNNTIPVDKMEIDAEKRHAEFLNDGYDRAAKYLCRWCRSAYTLFCLNPMCAQMGNRPNRNPSIRTRGVEQIDGHVFPLDFTRDVKDERREQRIRFNDSIREKQQALFEQLRERVRTYKATNPTRKSVVVAFPTIQEMPNYSMVGNKAFHDWNLPKSLGITYENVRVTLADGTYKPSTAAVEI